MPQRSLFDVQINGFSGVDFQQPELPLADLRRAVDALAAHQTLRFFLTLITDSLPALAAKLQNLERLRQRRDLGRHDIGPFPRLPHNKDLGMVRDAFFEKPPHPGGIHDTAWRPFAIIERVYFGDPLGHQLEGAHVRPVRMHQHRAGFVLQVKRARLPAAGEGGPAALHALPGLGAALLIPIGLGDDPPPFLTDGPPVEDAFLSGEVGEEGIPLSGAFQLDEADEHALGARGRQGLNQAVLPVRGVAAPEAQECQHAGQRSQKGGQGGVRRRVHGGRS